MHTLRKATNEELYSLLNELKDSDKAVIVEGHKDKLALEGFDIKNIFTLHAPLYKLVEFVSSNFKEVAILTDLDKEGKKLYGELNARLQERGVKVDNKLRHFLFKNTKLRQIEGLQTYLKNH
ncbi:MAG: toprim domain-containing protein [Nanoarchaeota archaeon]|nr:toprim domain-containing protein [DPANN group archaeon]MBL7116473.1 toprim domain-containing protein [Nanoarchaeota archaeon]